MTHDFELSLRKPSVFAAAGEHQMVVNSAFLSPAKRNAVRHVIANEISGLSGHPKAIIDPNITKKAVARIQEIELSKIVPPNREQLLTQRRALSVQPRSPQVFVTQSGRQVDLSGTLTASKKPVINIQEPQEVDPFDPT